MIFDPTGASQLEQTLFGCCCCSPSRRGTSYSTTILSLEICSQTKGPFSAGTDPMFWLGVRSHVGVRRATSFGKASMAGLQRVQRTFLINLEGFAGLEFDPMTKIPRTAGSCFRERKWNALDTQEAEFHHPPQAYPARNHLLEQNQRTTIFSESCLHHSASRETRSRCSEWHAAQPPLPRASTAPA